MKLSLALSDAGRLALGWMVKSSRLGPLCMPSVSGPTRPRVQTYGSANAGYIAPRYSYTPPPGRTSARSSPHLSLDMTRERKEREVSSMSESLISLKFHEHVPCAWSAARISGFILAHCFETDSHHPIQHVAHNAATGPYPGAQSLFALASRNVTLGSRFDPKPIEDMSCSPPLSILGIRTGLILVWAAISSTGENRVEHPHRETTYSFGGKPMWQDGTLGAQGGPRNGLLVDGDAWG